MPSCNLAETVHNKWLQQSGKRGSDLYTAAVDDYVRAFMQVVAYYQYLKGEGGGTGPGKEELRLRAAKRKAQCTGNPAVLKGAMAAMPGADEFCMRDPHLEGAEVFGSRKRKPNLLLGSEHESHRPDKVNFSHPCGLGRVTRTRVALAAVEDDVEDQEEVHVLPSSSEPKEVKVLHSSPEPMPTPPQDGTLVHVTAVKETL